MSGYELSYDPARLDRDAIHRYLSEESYWSPGVAREVVEAAIEGSIVVGAYASDGAFAGYARVVSDRATFAWLADVFVLPGHRGRGLGRRIVESALAHPDLQGLRTWMLRTADAHELYRPYGFMEPREPQNVMIRGGGAGSPAPPPQR